MLNNNVLNQFNGELICLERLENILSELEHKSVNVEIVKPVMTSQYYDSFEWNEYKDTLSLEDESMETPSVSLKIEDIKEIINGIGIYTEHLLIRLGNQVEVMLWLNP